MKIDPKLRERFSEGTSDEEMIRTVFKVQMPSITEEALNKLVGHMLEVSDDYSMTLSGLATRR